MLCSIVEWYFICHEICSSHFSNLYDKRLYGVIYNMSCECDVLVWLQVACMQFINIIVHSVEDVNFRVHLQHEFSLLGLDDYLVVCFCLHTSTLHKWLCL